MSLYFNIIKQYSQALYFNVIQKNMEKKILKQIIILEKIVINSSLSRLLSSPIISNKIKKNIIDSIAIKFQLHKKIVHFSYLLIKNSRFFLLSDIRYYFAKIIIDKSNIKSVYITSAYKLKTEEINMIKSFLELKINKKINLITNINLSLIGGAIIQYDHNLIDCSIIKVIKKIKKILVDYSIQQYNTKYII